MALIAIRVRELIVPADVAIEAWPRLMRSGERERRRRVIEGGRRPGRLCVTRRAIQRELIRHMRWIHGCVEVRLVALHAIRIYQLVISADVTGLAGLCDMGTLQRKIGRGVIEGRRPPGIERMTRGAVV